MVEALPAGLDTRLDEGGRALSGGQRQRLVLARALLTAPDVLVLEDPTSSADTHTEARVVERVAAARAGRTTIVFSDSPLWRGVADPEVRLDPDPAPGSPDHSAGVPS